MRQVLLDCAFFSAAVPDPALREKNGRAARPSMPYVTVLPASGSDSVPCGMLVGAVPAYASMKRSRSFRRAMPSLPSEDEM